jgi:hypothetical protein
MEGYDIFLVETDIGLERDDEIYTGYHIQFVEDGVKWMGEILEESEGVHCVEWFNGGEAPNSWKSVDEFVKDNFDTIQKTAMPRIIL